MAKMNKKVMLTLVLVAHIGTVMAQSLTLDDCRRQAQVNYPAIRQYDMIARAREYTLDNVVKGWLPQLSVQGGVVAFTDVMAVNDMMAQAGMDRKNYAAGAVLTLKQNVYDGGQMAASKRMAKAQAEVESSRLDVSMYAVREQVDQLFFGVLLLDEQLKQNAVLVADLTTSENNVRSMMNNGVANQTDVDAIVAEKLKVEQQRDVLAASRRAYLRVLGIFIGKTLDDSATLVKPAMLPVSPPSGRPAVTCRRPELQYYASQNRLLDAQRQQLDSRLRPTVGIFGTALAHSRVSYMVNNSMLFGGISLSWNIGALYSRKNDLRKLEVRREINDNQLDVFLFNNRLDNEQTGGEVDALRSSIARDEEIVKLRERIRSKADRRVELGVESVNELVADINAVSLARAQRAQHEVQLLRQLYRIQHLNNE